MLISGLLGDWFLPFLYNISTAGFRSSLIGWFFVGGLLALDQMRRREQAAQATINQPVGHADWYLSVE
jgi:hypothetical protein